MQKVKEPGLNAYAQSDSLLFQFILSEFLISFQKIREVEEVYRNMEELLIKKRLQADVSEHLTGLLELIRVLTGSHMMVANEQSFSWTHAKGCLNKLRHYCYLLSHRQADRADVTHMNVCVSKAFHGALQAREIIFSLQRRNPEDQRVPNYVSLYQLLDRLLDNVNRVSRLILKILFRYREDENVLFFLLGHQRDFDFLYQTEFVLKILKKMYPRGGVKEVKELLEKKYAERGFYGLVETISERVAFLDDGDAREKTHV